jgi:hypothetical protein
MSEMTGRVNTMQNYVTALVQQSAIIIFFLVHKEIIGLARHLLHRVTNWHSIFGISWLQTISLLILM